MKKIYLLFYASDSRHLQHLSADKFFELIADIHEKFTALHKEMTFYKMTCIKQ